MRLYLDTANPLEWSLPEGCPPLQGVTTNPTLIHRAGFQATLKTYLYLVDQAGERKVPELMLQALRPEAGEVMAWLDELLPASARARTRLIIKVPCHPDWQHVIETLRQWDIPFLITGVSNPMQLLWAKTVGAAYVAPYLGRIEAAGRDPWPLVEAAVRLQDSGVKLVAASIRNEETFTRLMAAGSYSATVQPGFAKGLVLDDLTETAIRQFNQDIEDSQKHPPVHPA